MKEWRRSSISLKPKSVRWIDYGMVMGSHGVHHYVFSKLPLERQREEIAGSFASLATLLGEAGHDVLLSLWRAPHLYGGDGLAPKAGGLPLFVRRQSARDDVGGSHWQPASPTAL